MGKRRILNNLALAALEPDKYSGSIKQSFVEEARTEEITNFEFVRAIIAKRVVIPWTRQN